MIMRRKMFIKSALLAVCAVALLAQCSEEEIAPQQSLQVESTLPATAATTGSMTISGSFTTYEDIADCKTCTFVVPQNATIIDGKELGIKPGAVICLDKAEQYRDIEFVNLEGTEKHPIKIGTTTIPTKN